MAYILKLHKLELGTDTISEIVTSSKPVMDQVACAPNKIKIDNRKRDKSGLALLYLSNRFLVLQKRHVRLRLGFVICEVNL